MIISLESKEFVGKFKNFIIKKKGFLGWIKYFWKKWNWKWTKRVG